MILNNCRSYKFENVSTYTLCYGSHWKINITFCVIYTFIYLCKYFNAVLFSEYFYLNCKIKTNKVAT